MVLERTELKRKGGSFHHGTPLKRKKIFLITSTAPGKGTDRPRCDIICQGNCPKKGEGKTESLSGKRRNHLRATRGEGEKTSLHYAFKKSRCKKRIENSPMLK